MLRVTALCLLLVASQARADVGDWALGPRVSLTHEGVAQLGASGNLGLGDWLALRGGVEAIYDDGHVGVTGRAGPAIVLDVLQWVPDAGLYAGAVRLRRDVRVYADAELGLRRHLSLTWSVRFSGGARWLQNQRVAALFGVAVWWAPPL